MYGAGVALSGVSSSAWSFHAPASSFAFLKMYRKVTSLSIVIVLLALLGNTLGMYYNNKLYTWYCSFSYSNFLCFHCISHALFLKQSSTDVYSLCWFLSSTDDSFIVEHPKNQSLYQGNTAIFQCITFRFDAIVWSVNKSLPELMNLSAPSLMIGDDVHTRVSRLEVPARIEYNNSRILCIGLLFFNTSQMSRTALLLVQGKLIMYTNTYVHTQEWIHGWGVPGCPFLTTNEFIVHLFHYNNCYFWQLFAKCALLTMNLIVCIYNTDLYIYIYRCSFPSERVCLMNSFF